MMLACVLALMTVGSIPAAPAQPPATAASASMTDQRAQAYYEFLEGRHLEGEGQVDAAIAAYKRASALDPRSAEVHAELAALYARQNRAEEAMKAAEAALAVDADNVEAHWVLGTVYAALAQGAQDDTPTTRDAVDKAILHLEKARPERRYDLGLSLALGRLYLRKGDYPKAIELLQWLTAQGAGAAEVSYLLAQAFEGAGRRPDAIAMLRETVAEEPRYFRAWVALADLLEKDRQFADAAEAYGRAVAQNPHSVELRLRQAGALLSAGQTAASGAVLRDVVKEAPTEGAALYMLAEVERQLKNYDEAESAAKRLVALEPKQLRGAYALALVYDARREYRKVIDTLTPVAAGGGDQPSRLAAPIQVRLGAAYQALGEFGPAIAAFERAKASSGGDPVFDAYLAQALVEGGQTTRALALMAEARKAHPDDLRLARVEADALARSGDTNRAIAVLEQEVAQRADSLDARLALAALCTEHDRFECASQALDAAERRFPDELQVEFQRGALLERQKRYDEAEAAMRKVLAHDPLHGPTLNYLGYMLADRGVRLDEAVSLVERAVQTDPWNPSYLDSLGWAHFKRGDLEQARKALSLAAERLPRNSVVQDHWGDLLAKEGDRASAIAAWEKSLAGDRESIDPAAIQRKIDDARRSPQ